MTIEGARQQYNRDLNKSKKRRENIGWLRIRKYIR